MIKKLKRKLILASTSPQRKKLLRQAGFRFEIIPSRVKEDDPDTIPAKKAASLVKRLARLKASAVAKSVSSSYSWVLGADTLVSCRGKILGKPKNIRHAEEMLRRLSGSWQTVWTGVCVIATPEQKILNTVAKTKLRFRKLSEDEIIKVAKENLDKSGAYAIQEMKDPFVKEILGDLDTVIGLPISVVKKLIREAR